MHTWSFRGAPGLLGLALLVGCGGTPTGAVKGQVVYKGTPVKAGFINVHLKEKGLADQTKIVEGAFEFKNELPTGAYAVYVSPPIPEPTDPSKPRPAPLPPVALPKKSTDLATSPLKIDVKPGINDVKLELTD